MTTVTQTFGQVLSEYEDLQIFFGIGCILIIITSIIMWLLHKSEITVTSKRVWGKTELGQMVDLPLDSISAVGTGLFKSITVSTSSGTLHFILIKNRDEIYKAISDLLLERQKQKGDLTGELKQYKELLDSGVITQEEFETKKKQLLNL